MQQNKLTIQTKIAPDFSTLKAAGYNIKENNLGGYLDGITATKTVKGKTVDVYVGSDDGHVYFAPQAYVNDQHIGEAATPSKAARMAEIRALFSASKGQSQMPAPQNS